MIRLGVNIDHVATLRNARGESYPQPVHLACLAQMGGADNITCHLREDRRHIRDDDVFLLRQVINVPLNLEIAATKEMLELALKVRPHAVTLVPEKRQELTTEGGLDLKRVNQEIKDFVKSLKENSILAVLFVEANEQSIYQSDELGADAVELHTGDFCSGLHKAKTTREQRLLLEPLKSAAHLAHTLGLQVHVGHGLNYQNAQWMRQVPHCEEANIGHAIVAQALGIGMTQAVRDMKSLLNNHNPIS